MRVLIVTGQIAGAGSNPWLLDDLAVALADAGDDVDVLVYDTKRARAAGPNGYPDKRIRVFSAGPTRIRNGRVGKVVNYAVAGWRLHTLGFGLVRRRQYDLCIYTSIGAFSWGLPGRLRRGGIVRRLVFVLWDFFPIHQLEIGRIRRQVLHQPLRAIEGLAMRDADAIAVMSPANERFLRKYHPRIRVPTVIVPPWSSDPESRAPRLQRRDRFTVVFGGQLVSGRGVDTLLDAARRIQDEGKPIDFLIVGDGPARQSLIDHARTLGLENTEFVNLLPRAEYRNLLQTVHVGVAITVPGVSPPTFPSKIVEYCAASLPVVVSVEPSSDAGTWIEQSGAGLTADAGDDVSLTKAIANLYKEFELGKLEARSKLARKLFEQDLSAVRAAETIRAVAR